MGKWSRRAFIPPASWQAASSYSASQSVLAIGRTRSTGDRRRGRNRIQCLAEDCARQQGHRHHATCRDGPGCSHDPGDDARRRTGCGLGPGGLHGSTSDKEYANYALAKGYAAGDVDFPSWLIDTVDGFFLTATKAMNLQITGGSTSVPTTGQVGMRVAGAATGRFVAGGRRRMEGAVTELRLKKACRSWAAPGVRPMRNLRCGSRNIAAGQAGSKKAGRIHHHGYRRAAIRRPAQSRWQRKIRHRRGVARHEVRNHQGLSCIRRCRQKLDESSIQDMPGVRKVVNLGDAVAVIADGYWQAKKALDRLGSSTAKRQ